MYNNDYINYYDLGFEDFFSITTYPLLLASSYYPTTIFTIPTTVSIIFTTIDSNMVNSNMIDSNMITHDGNCSFLENQRYLSYTNSLPKLTEKSVEKSFVCHVCNRAFARKHDLQRHIRIHTGDKPYHCPCCQKSFARTDALKRHLRMEQSCRNSHQVQVLKNTGKRKFRNL